MMTYQLEPRNYFEVLESTVQKSKNRLQRYLQDPTEENIHDTRTSIRRLEAAWAVLPKKVRHKRRASEFVSAYKSFFKANSKVRDCDIIRQRLDSIPLDTEEIKKTIEEIKNRQLHIAKKEANRASKLKFPKLSHDMILRAKLEKRFRKVMFKLVKDVQDLIPIVVNSEKNTYELHELRKKCKKLRYTMELLPSSGTSNFLDKLKQMQDLLGTIHDSDITIDFVTKFASKHKDMDEILKIELNKRRQLYNSFVKIYQVSNMQRQNIES